MSERIGDWLCTYTGVSFYPLDPRPEEVSIADIAHALALQCRFGGHCKVFYSVAQHSVMVADVFVKRVRFRNDGTGPGTPGACLAALLHDAAEAYVLDLPRPVKRMFPAYKADEKLVQQAIWDRFGIDTYDATHAGIKTCDNILLATEKRDLMPERSQAWAPLPDPLPDPIIPLPPSEAETLFLRRFFGLYAVHKEMLRDEG